MRCRHGYVSLIAFALASLAGGQEAGGGPTQFVCLDVDDVAVAIEPLPEGRPIPSLPDLVQDRELSHCWTWNDTCPPRRITVEEDVPAGDLECGEVRALDIRTTGSGEDPEQYRFTAAPVEMWWEVPRGLLPAIETDSPLLTVPRGSGAWRLQALAGPRASTWQDITSEQGSTTLSLLPATDFRFTVTGGAQPLENARFYLVRPRRVGPAEILGHQVTDGHGAVTLTLPTTAAPAVLVSHDSRAARSFGGLEEVPETVELAPGLVVSGQVVTDEGASAGIMRLEGLSFVRDGFQMLRRHRGRTGQDGRFAIPGFSAGPASLQTEGSEIGFWRTFELDSSLDLGSIMLAPRETAWVRIVDSRDNAPVAGATIRGPSGRVTAVAEEGLAPLALDFGRRVIVRASGYLRTELELPRLAGQTSEEPFIVALAPAFSVRGTFVSSDGHTPAVHGQVKVQRQPDGMFILRAMAPDGSFDLDLAGGSWELELTAGNAGLRRLEIRGAGGERRDLGVVSAPPSAWVRGYLVSGENYAPVGGATLSWTQPSEFGPLLPSALGRVVTVTTNEQGYFEMFGLEPGPTTLRVQADGFAPRKLEVEAEALEGVDVGVVELSRGRTITVRSDVDDGLVVLDLGHTGLPDDRLSGRLVDGEARFRAVPEEPFGVLVHEAGAAVCEKVEDSTEGDRVVTCSREATRVTGVVTRGGVPGSGKLFWRRGSGAGLPEGGVTLESGPFRRTQALVSTQTLELEATLGRDGRYRLESVLPGEWEVIWAPFEGGAQDVRSVVVPEGRQTVLDFRYEGVSIEGFVLDPDGMPARRANVTVFPERKTVRTDENGRFEVLGLQPGRYQLRARLMDQRSVLVEVVLYDSSDREVVQLVLEEDPPAEELVITLRGGGSGFCFVEMDRATQHIVRLDSGVARVRPAPPLPDRVRVACQTEGRWILDAWQDLKRAIEEGVSLDPQDSTSSIHLVAASSPAKVQIVGPGGWDLGRLRLWFGGASDFSTGETISNLPVGEYTLRWNGQARTVRTERRRTSEVELGGE